MRGYLLRYVIPFILFATAGLNAFDDRPALTVKGRVALVTSKVVGATLGLVVALPFLAASERSCGRERAFLLAGGAAGSLGGSIVMYNAVGYLANRLIAWRHGVSYAVEKATRFYGINVEQYWLLIDAAVKNDSEGLHRVIADVYEQRFGADWQSKLQEFLVNYKDFAVYLSRRKKSSLSKKEHDLIRMIEMGAALENIYFRTKPSRKTSVERACKIYPFLGFDIGLSEKLV